MNPKTVWGDARVAQLRDLLAKGLHDAQIAAEMGLTYIAVNKKRHRLGLPINPLPHPPKPDKPKSISVLRIENEQPWEPLPGMLKRRCQRCHFWFAAPDMTVGHCADCRLLMAAAARAAC